MNDKTDPNAEQHRATVDRILGVGSAAAATTSRAAMAAAGAITIPTMHQVENSKQIAEHGYDPETAHLFLRFHGKGKPGALYRYGNFGETDLQAFLDAESKGSHFARAIKPHGDRYPCERVPEAALEPSDE